MFQLIEEESAGRIDPPTADQATSRRFMVSRVVGKGSKEVASFESDIIAETKTDFAGWEAEGIFLEQGGKDVVIALN